MEVKWLQSLREYLKHVDGTIEIDADGVLPVQRANDFYIMDAIIQSGRFTPKEIRLLNYCRMYLQALTASDITTADGINLDYAKLYGHYHPITSANTNIHHFHQERPDDEVWRIWFRANLIWSDGTQLKEALGGWTIPHSQQRQNAPAYYNRPDRSLYLPTADNQYRKYSLSGELSQSDNGLNIVPILPASALPTRIRADTSWIQPDHLPSLY